VAILHEGVYAGLPSQTEMSRDYRYNWISSDVVRKCCQTARADLDWTGDLFEARFVPLAPVGATYFAVDEETNNLIIRYGTQRL
jgi:hypothetical protein